jgi:hypothetical protein
MATAYADINIRIEREIQRKIKEEWRKNRAKKEISM